MKTLNLKTCFAALALTLASVGVAGAAGASSAAAEQRAALAGSTLKQTQSVTNAGKGCWQAHRKFERKALLGNTLYSYWQTTRICTSKGKVTSVKVLDAGGETSTPGWRIAKKPTTSTKIVGSEGRGKAQFYFVLGAGPWDIQHPTDCIQLRLKPKKKAYSASKSCNLAGS